MINSSTRARGMREWRRRLIADACQCRDFPPRWLGSNGGNRRDLRVRMGNVVSESGDIVTDTATRIFADLADPQAINSAKDDGWKAPLWQALADAGLTLAWVPEDAGGAGASLADGFKVLGVAGRFAAPVPLAERSTLAAKLAAGRFVISCELSSPSGTAPQKTVDHIHTIYRDPTNDYGARLVGK